MPPTAGRTLVQLIDRARAADDQLVLADAILAIGPAQAGQARAGRCDP